MTPPAPWFRPPRLRLGSALCAILIVGLGLTIVRQSERINELEVSLRFQREVNVSPAQLKIQEDTRKRAVGEIDRWYEELNAAKNQKLFAARQAASVEARMEIIRLKERVKELEWQLLSHGLLPASDPPAPRQDESSPGSPPSSVQPNSE